MQASLAAASELGHPAWLRAATLWFCLQRQPYVLWTNGNLASDIATSLGELCL